MELWTGLGIQAAWVLLAFLARAGCGGPGCGVTNPSEAKPCGSSSPSSLPSAGERAMPRAGGSLSEGCRRSSFSFYFTVSGAVWSLASLLISGRGARILSEPRSLGGDFWWLVVSIVASCIGGLCIYHAIGGRNATVASLIEISYPLFVALFAWLFFRELQINWQTALGGLLILSGVSIVFLSNRS